MGYIWRTSVVRETSGQQGMTQMERKHVMATTEMQILCFRLILSHKEPKAVDKNCLLSVINNRLSIRKIDNSLEESCDR